MKIIIQRVKKASVEINQKLYSEIGRGLLVLIGINHTDTKKQAEWLAHKTANLRIFEDREGKMNLSAKDIHGEILVVPNFTLYADAKKGFRPSFIEAARPETATPLYEEYVNLLKNMSLRSIQTGVFGADMQVIIENDGPVTIVIEKND